VAATPSAAAPAAAPRPQQQTASAEPRRVRTVPIRADNGDAPARAQSQPRVVPAAPRPEPAETVEDANAPLRITPQANRPARAEPRVAAAAPAAVPSSQTTQSTPEPAAAASGSGFAVQLAAEGSEDAAKSKFARMKGQYGSVLGGYNPNIRSAEVNGRSVYRVRVGNLSREDAVGLCEKLKAEGGSCFVARN
jgi:septal ring-binding cell division protein DamX